MILSWDIDGMASYDDLGKIRESAYVLEKGSYCFYVGVSVRDAVELPYHYEMQADRIVQQLFRKCAPTSLRQRMLADGSFEELPVTTPVETDANELVPLTVAETDGFAPAARAGRRYHLWVNTMAQQHRFLREVAQGSITLDEFMGQLSDEDLANLLGGQPNTGVANTFGWGNLPEYGVPNVMTADRPCRASDSTGMRCLYNGMAVRDTACLLMERRACSTGRRSRRGGGQGKQYSSVAYAGCQYSQKPSLRAEL